MNEKQKSVLSVVAEVRHDPTQYIEDHIIFQAVGRPLKSGVTFSTRSFVNVNYRSIKTAIKALDYKIARICLQAFMDKHKRMPDEGEKFKASIFVQQDQFTNRGGKTVTQYHGQIIAKP